MAFNITSGYIVCTQEYVELSIAPVAHYLDFYNEDHDILLNVGNAVPTDETSFKLPKGITYRLQGPLHGPIFIRGAAGVASDLFYIGG